MGVPVHDLDPLTPDPGADHRCRWRRCQGLLALLAVVALISTVRYVQHARFLRQQPHVADGPPLLLVDRVNPNTATWSSLARLPRIGETRARAIVDYRNAHAADAAPAFAGPDDLLRVPGIGPVTLEGIRPHLTFEP